MLFVRNKDRNYAGLTFKIEQELRKVLCGP